MGRTGRKDRAGRKERQRHMVMAFGPTDEALKAEKEKARDLRRSRWWKEKLAAGRCHYCGGEFPPEDLTMDHVVPLSRGGRSVKENLVPACKDCNSRKKLDLPLEMELSPDGDEP